MSSHVDNLKTTIANTSSRLLLTTEDERIAVHATKHTVRILKAQDSMELFIWVFKAAELPDENREHTISAEKVARWCGGLPLTLRVIGSMAASYRTAADWRTGLRMMHEKDKMQKVCIKSIACTVLKTQ